MAKSDLSAQKKEVQAMNIRSSPMKTRYLQCIKTLTALFAVPLRVWNTKIMKLKFLKEEAYSSTPMALPKLKDLTIKCLKQAASSAA
nr:hypothetical protein [Butyrivibrio sp.]